MAEKEEKVKETEKKEIKARPKRPEEKKELAMAESLVRILATDIPGNKNIYHGLTRIKGISYTISAAICHILGIDKNRKISSLLPEEIKKITDFVLKPSNLPVFLLNRRRDIETGESRHIVTTALELQHEFDIRRLKKIRSYRGWRHAKGLPVRGQRTKAHFRTGRTVGVIRAKVKPGTQAAVEKGKERKEK